MTEQMDLTRFEELAMTHGPDLAVWPEGQRAAAETLLAQSAEARAARAAAALLFDALAEEAARPAPASAALMARILADAADAAPPRKSARASGARGPFGFSVFWRLLPPAALTASAVLGVAVGYSAPDSYGAAFGIESDAAYSDAASLTGEPDLFGVVNEGEGL
jgi:hypothetical protein